ncbi:MAG TPA: glycoside hydrolase family 2 TIM barrel-domain containing protein [Candidatus Sulfotelmatobacter sp.]|nr:glycoside hydrolase family 2 TIM barrel-domain containing protein [Candidatus Sulfotelmatobacter sp.]
MRKYMRFLAAFGFSILFGPPAGAQVAPLIANLSARHTVSLNGAWRAIVDPYDAGSIDYHAHPLRNNSAFYADHKPESKSELVEYDFDNSGQLTVPGDWNSQRESLLFYEGSIWYKTAFDYSLTTGKRLFVHFGAANYKASVYLNGTMLGEHEGGFTPFDFEITGQVRAGNNVLVVLVNNSRKADRVPALSSDWWNYGGITRPVTLVETSGTFIQDYLVQLSKGDQQQLRGWVKLNGPQHRQKVSIHIPEAGVATTLETDANGKADFSVPATLTLWSPEQPKLYDVEISAETDRVTDQIGFRTIEARGTELLLNGKPVFLRGINLHEEAPLREGRAWSNDDARKLLGWAKDLGCNFVRLAHYPHSEEMLRVADQLGLMVWEEVPVYWAIDWENPETLKNVENQLNEAIARDHNRAALIIYSVGNETPVSEARTRFLRALVQDARSLDNTRLISAALQNHETKAGNHITVRIDDPVGNDLDVIGDNEYIGWYVDKPADADAVEWVSDFNKPLIMTEFGGDALFGYHGETDTRWTEEYQEDLYQHQIAMLKRIPFLRGVAPWVLMDFRSPRRTLPKFQDYFNRKGLLTKDGQKKKAYFVLQEFYRDIQAKPEKTLAGQP